VNCGHGEHFKIASAQPSARMPATLRATLIFTMLRVVSTITAILEPNADGTLHLPLPADCPQGLLRVIANVEAVAAPQTTGQEWHPPQPRRLGVRPLTAEQLRNLARADEDGRGLPGGPA
jgi:hypothetical protein